jgi:hypothetical protein
MPRGGRRPGAGRPGRPKGSVCAKTKARLEMARLAAEGGISPLDMMIQYARERWDAGDKKEACRIAEAAAPYIHPRLSTIQQNTKLEGDTLSALMRAIDGKTIGIADGTEPDESSVAPGEPISHH